MLITFTPFHPEHLKVLTPHESQQNEYRNLIECGLDLAARSVALTAWSGARCLGAGGVFPVWAGRAEAWGVFSNQTGPAILPVARKIKYVLDTYPARRLEMTVKDANIQGHRLATLLGFTDVPYKLRAYHPDGSDMFLYERIR